jgi:hypothetical protein
MSTYIETAYFGKGSALPDEWTNTGVLAHEVAEWIADPTLWNVVPSWEIPTRPGQCFSPAREIADPLEELPGLQVPLAGRLYNLPDVVFDAYFRRDARSRSVNRQLTLLNQFQDTSIPCSYDELGRSSFWFLDPSNGGPLATTLTGVNNQKGAVGYYQLDGFNLGFVMSGYDPIGGDLGVPSFIGVPVPGQPGYSYWTLPAGLSDNGTVVGYFWDGAQYHGFTESNDQYTTIDVPGALATLVTGINNRPDPDIVGQYTDAAGSNHGFVLRRGKFTTVDAPFGVDTRVNAINDSREIVGSYDSGAGRAGFQASLSNSNSDDRATAFVAVTWPDPSPDVALDLELTGVNGHGEVVGILTASNIYGSLTHPFELVNGAFQILDFGFDADEGKVGVANAVNDDGFIAGGTVIPQGTVAETWIPYNLIYASGAQAAPPDTLAPLAAWRPAGLP